MENPSAHSHLPYPQQVEAKNQELQAGFPPVAGAHSLGPLSAASQGAPSQEAGLEGEAGLDPR